MRPLFVTQLRAPRASLKIKSYALTHSRQRGATISSEVFIDFRRFRRWLSRLSYKLDFYSPLPKILVTSIRRLIPNGPRVASWWLNLLKRSAN